MERETEDAFDPLAAELAKAWATILPRVRSAVAEALADEPDGAAGADADALVNALLANYRSRYVAIRSVFRCGRGLQSAVPSPFLRALARASARALTRSMHARPNLAHTPPCSLVARGQLLRLGGGARGDGREG
jgi:hypothetical protein